MLTTNNQILAFLKIVLSLREFTLSLETKYDFILIIVIQKYLTIKSPHVPNGKPRDRVGVGGGSLAPPEGVGKASPGDG